MTIKWGMALCLSFCVLLSACSQEDIHFSTAFEGVQVDQNTYRIVSENASMSSVFDRYTKKKRGKISINYETKNLEAAKAEVVDAPGLDDNKALRFKASSPNVYKDGKPSKTRIQLQLVKKSGVSAFVSEVSVFLPASMDTLNRCPYPITWLTLQEFWNALHLSNQTTFRITIGLWKSKRGKLHFGFKAQDNIDGEYVDVARGNDECMEVPFGRWFKLRTEVAEGDSTIGFFKLTMWDNGQESVLYQQTMQTMSTAICEGRFPREGFNNLQPLKLYTSAWLTEWMREQGCALEVYFADWTLDAYRHGRIETENIE